MRVCESQKKNQKKPRNERNEERTAHETTSEDHCLEYFWNDIFCECNMDRKQDNEVREFNGEDHRNTFSSFDDELWSGIWKCWSVDGNATTRSDMQGNNRRKDAKVVVCCVLAMECIASDLDGLSTAHTMEINSCCFTDCAWTFTWWVSRVSRI